MQNSTALPDLQVLPTALLMPHEDHDPRRVERLQKRMLEEGLLKNPPVVAPIPGSEKYVILDGANRCLSFAMAGIPHIVVNTLEDLATDPHLVQTGFWQFQDHPTEGRLRHPSFPVNFGSTPAAITKPAPRLGEHTEEVLREAGLDAAAIAALKASGAALDAAQASKSVGKGGD